MKRPLSVFNFSFKNSGEKSVDIHVDGDIVDASTQEILRAWLGDETSVSFKSFRDLITSVDADVYNVYINSQGGIVTDAMAMHDFLEELEGKGKTVNRIGRGIVASAATYLLMGKNSSMTKNSWMMIHNVSGAIWGDVNEIENYAATLRKFNDRSRDFYSEGTQIRKEEISKMMNKETFMTADEARDRGFIKNVVGAQEFTQAISREDWPYQNLAVLNSYNASVKTMGNQPDSITQKLDEMKSFWQNLGKEIMNAIKGVKAPENNDHTQLMTSIGEAVNQTFIAQAEPMEKAVNEAVAEGNKIDFSKDGPAKTALDSAIATAISNAIDFTKEGPVKTAFDTAVKNAVAAETKEDKQTIEELKKDITNLKGKKSQADPLENSVTPIGRFN